MAVGIGKASVVSPGVAGTAAAGPAVAPSASVEQIAQEFEAMLLAQMVRQMRQSFLSEEENGEGVGLGMQTMTETIDVELARALSRAGGIGLADVIQRSMTRAAAPGMATPAQPVPAVTESLPEPVVLSTPHALSATPSASLAGLRLPLESSTSEYGWRADPFHGHRRFHAGIDLKGAYGQEVPTAGAGRVVSAGEQGAYGLTVVVEHDHGVQTRYAHLSAIGVKPGEVIAAGTVVGRVGQSGRATGPHLHFEVLVNGRRVDPTMMARAAGPAAGLKLPAGVDD
jgi:murein DD-endopeptidase MepM/ murein hydrolase activator NlpD